MRKEFSKTVFDVIMFLFAAALLVFAILSCSTKPVANKIVAEYPCEINYSVDSLVISDLPKSSGSVSVGHFYQFVFTSNSYCKRAFALDSLKDGTYSIRFLSDGMSVNKTYLISRGQYYTLMNYAIDVNDYYTKKWDEPLRKQGDATDYAHYKTINL